jgi:hypothetical protein
MPYALHRRIPVPQQYEQSLRTTTFPAPTRGIVQSENESYMQPGGANIQDNWAPTMRGVKLRGGTVRYCDLHALDATVPPVPSALRQPVISAFTYVSGTAEKMFAAQPTKLFDVTLTTPVLVKSGQTSGNYAAAQMNNAAGEWLIACNESGDHPLRFNGTSWVTLDGVNPTPGDGASQITGPAPGLGPPPALSYVWKYRNRLFFIQKRSMSAWYLDINSVGGALLEIPLSGAAGKGGTLLFGAVYSTDAGDGNDDKCVFVTTLGEVLVFTGTNPGDAANWRQEGRWSLGRPMGMNAHIQIGGDLMVLTIEGIVPLSVALARDISQTELAMLTRTIKPMWRENVAKRTTYPWTIARWDEYGALFVTWPGGNPGDRMCAVSNLATGAWCRFIGYDALCFLRRGADLFYGTQDGIIMQGERTGYDDGNHARKPYLATLVGGWEMFGAPAANFIWHQARANFHSAAGEPFQPQLAAAVNYNIVLPSPPQAGPDPGPLDIWDQGIWGPSMWTPPAMWANATAYAVGATAYDGPAHNYWTAAVAHTSAAAPTVFAADRTAHPTYWTLASPQPGPPVPTPTERDRYAQWDQPGPIAPPVRSTLWVSIGETGYAHAPIVQVTVAQAVRPQVELISIGATYEPAGVNV